MTSIPVDDDVPPENIPSAEEDSQAGDAVGSDHQDDAAGGVEEGRPVENQEVPHGTEGEEMALENREDVGTSEESFPEKSVEGTHENYVDVESGDGGEDIQELVSPGATDGINDFTVTDARNNPAPITGSKIYEQSQGVNSGSSPHLKSAAGEVAAGEVAAFPMSKGFGSFDHLRVPSEVASGGETTLTVRDIYSATDMEEEVNVVGAQESLPGESTREDVSPAAKVLRVKIDSEEPIAMMPFTSSDEADAANTQDNFKLDIVLDIKAIDHTTCLKDVGNDVSPDPNCKRVEQMKDEPIDPPSPGLYDDRLPHDSRKNPIQGSNLNSDVELQNGNKPSRLTPFSQTPSFSEKPNPMESTNTSDTKDLKTDVVPAFAAAVSNMEYAQDERASSGPVLGDSISSHMQTGSKCVILVTSAAELPNSIGSTRDEDMVVQSHPLSLDETDAGLAAERSALTKSKSHLQDKTELEREMELFEASEREGAARLLNSMRSDQLMQVDPPDEALKDVKNDKKRASDSVLLETRKKKGKKDRAHADEVLEEEDVCFICFDGGELVLCDRRTCPKAYHLSCIGRDTAFFQKKGAWICGWHFCAMCTKPATFQCYTCPTAYCGNCLDKADFICVRRRKGHCEECWPIVKMIENQEVNADGVEVDFSDQETYEGLFKEYWEDLKSKVSLTRDEFDKDCKTDGGRATYLEFSGSEDKLDPENISTDSEDDVDDGEDEEEDEDEDEDEDEEEGAEKEEDPEAMDEEEKNVARRKGKRKGRSLKKNVLGSAGDPVTENEDVDAPIENEEESNEGDVEKQHRVPPREFQGWASKSLIEFIKYMDEDPKKPLTKFQVLQLLWAYIKSQKLQDPRKKTQISLDERLRSLFGGETISKFDVAKYIQLHFSVKGEAEDASHIPEEHGSLEESLAGADVSPAVDERSGRLKDVMRDKRRRKKGEDEKVERPNVDEFAAVTPKNISLIYLKRQLIEELLDDPDFENKVHHTYVRIRVPAGMNNNKSEMCYRLVLVERVKLQNEYYRAGRKHTNVVLEIQNLQKKEDVTIDVISNHDFTEEECLRLRTSIKCSFLPAMSVGQVEEKARALQPVKLKDWLESEKQRLVNLRDRASEKGRKRELRECVEKLQEITRPEFVQERLEIRPEVEADPNMNPQLEEPDANEEISGSTVEKSGPWEKTSGSQLPSNVIKNSSNDTNNADWDGSKNRFTDTQVRGKEQDRPFVLMRSIDKTFGRAVQSNAPGVAGNAAAFDNVDRGWRMDTQDGGSASGWTGNGRNRMASSQKWNEQLDLTVNVDTRSSRGDFRSVSAGMITPVFDPTKDWARREPLHPATPSPSVPLQLPVPIKPVLTQAALEAAEKEKAWHYMDPTGTVQGPFSMEQLRKWNTTGYFPEDLRIWRIDQPRDESILLKDALAGRSANDGTLPFSARSQNSVGASFHEEIAQAINPDDSWKDNGGASGCRTDRGGVSDVSRSTVRNPDGSQGGRSFSRDSGGPSGQFREIGDLKWKRGSASGNWDSYGRSSSFSNSPSMGTRGENPIWGNRSSGSRSERDNWGSSPALGNDGGGHSKTSTSRNSWGRGTQQHRDEGSTWNADDPGANENSRSRNATRAARKDIPCRFYQKGYCRRGDSCDFWHG